MHQGIDIGHNSAVVILDFEAHVIGFGLVSCNKVGVEFASRLLRWKCQAYCNGECRVFWIVELECFHQIADRSVN